MLLQQPQPGRLRGVGGGRDGEAELSKEPAFDFAIPRAAPVRWCESGAVGKAFREPRVIRHTVRTPSWNSRASRAIPIWTTFVLSRQSGTGGGENSGDALREAESRGQRSI